MFDRGTKHRQRPSFLVYCRRSLVLRRPAFLLVVALLLPRAEIRAQSALDGFAPGADGSVVALAVQADGKILVGGYFTMLGGGGTGSFTRNHIARLNPDGTLDNSFDPGANDAVTTLAVQPDGKILVGGLFTVLGDPTGTIVRSRIGRLNPNGTLDMSFNPGADDAVNVLAIQADGKIVVGGNFTKLGGGGSGTTTSNRIGRLNSDGTLDMSFTSYASGPPNAVAVQPDGKILVGGDFTLLGNGSVGTPTSDYIGRLNADGTLDTTFHVDASNIVYALALQPDGKVVVGGEFTALGNGNGGITRNHIARVSSNGTVESSFDPGANAAVYTLALQTDGKILVGGGFTFLGGGNTGNTARHRVGRLNRDGTLDTLFNPGADNLVAVVTLQTDNKILMGGLFNNVGGGDSDAMRNSICRFYADGLLETGFDPGSSGPVLGLAVQADGKILLGGFFTMLGGGGTGTTARKSIGRVDRYGGLDSAFDPGANDTPYALVIQPDDNILLGGFFTMLGGGSTGTTTRNRIGRLFTNGTIDPGFDPGASDAIVPVALQADGKILVGGRFSKIGGGGTGTTTRIRIARLSPGGIVDPNFDPGVGAVPPLNSPELFCLAVQADGKILVGGHFNKIGGGGSGTTTRNRIARLNPDGTVDANFDPGADDDVDTLVVQPDGKILAGGRFTMIGGGGTGTTQRIRIARLNADGTLDPDFNPGADNQVVSLALQANGKILIGGFFTALGGATRNRIGRLQPNGALDPSFDPGANHEVYALALQADGKIVAGGAFTNIGGGGAGMTSRNCIARLTNTDAGVQDIEFADNGTTIIWRRGGASPEVNRVTFESSPDGTNYTALPAPTRISGGWQLTGQSLSTQQDLFIRARGFYSTGYLNACGSIAEAVLYTFLPTRPTVQLGSPSYSVNENDGSVNITVAKTGADALAASVQYTTNNGSATAGVDYTAVSGVLSFAAGETTKNIVIPITDDSLFEGNETFTLTLSTPSGANLGSQSSAVVTIVDNDSQPTPTPTPTPTTTATPTPTATPGLVANVSTRLPVGTDDNVLIEGFIVQGPAGSTKKIIVRAIGPSLIAFGVTDALANPTLEIHDANNATIATNNDWKSTQVGGLITGDQSAEIAASGVAPGNDLESAIIANLLPGSYTAVVRGLGNTVGTGVVDAYDLSAASSAKVANIATRGLIQPGDKLMIAGFIIQNGPVKAVIRAIGPSLAAFGISNALPDTTLQLRDQNGTILVENDDWKIRSDGSSQQAELEATGLQPSDDREAALVTTLPPGQYTAQVRGKPETTGIGVVQVYFLP
jgi:uncharacterized delta-60 repeat protein